MIDPFIGQLMLCPYIFAPVGWMDCAGQILPVDQYAVLFSLLRNRYGGDGITTFALPNLQGQVAVSQGTAPSGTPYSLGKSGGIQTERLSLAELGAHSHPMMANAADATVNSPAGAALAKVNKFEVGGLYYPPPANTALAALTVAPAGGGGAHNNMQPYLVLRYVIAVKGVFPPHP
jgi:microcystin-dependent protein